MSYILEALRKAEAQREQTGVPGVFSQPTATLQAGDPGADSHSRRRLGWPVWLALGGIALLAGGWWLASGPSAEPPAEAHRDHAPRETAPPQRMAEAQQHTATGPDVPVTTLPAGPGPTTEPRPTAPPRGTETEQHRPPGMRPPGDRNEPGDPHQPSPTERMGGEALARIEAPAKLPPSTTPAPKVDRAKADARVLLTSELPEDVRRTLPTLVIGGAMYSDVPANRMLIVNSQVFHEGEQPAAGLTLESIRLKSAIFSYKGYRYSVSY